VRRYPELRRFGDWLQRRVRPAFAAASARTLAAGVP